MDQKHILSEIDQALAQNLGKESFTPGLERINFWIKTYGLLPQCKVVTIAGTNGKGETTHAFGHLLKTSGYSFCQWTSPHILAITERFISQYGQIPAQELWELVQKWLQRLPLHPQAGLSYFEFLFIVFLDWQTKLRPDFLLLEVGLGGRLDAVNALDADVVLLTSISRDHQDFLGHRYGQILMEKLGVLRAGGQLFSYLELKYLRQLTQKQVQALRVNWRELSSEFTASDFSSINHRLASCGFEALTGKKAASLESFRYPNRIVRELGQTQLHLFGSHNPDGVRKLVQFLGRHHYNNYDVLLLAFSKREQKDLISMIKSVAHLADQIWISSFSHFKAVEFEHLQKLLDGKIKGRVEFVRDYQTALQSIAALPKKVLVTGSYYFVAEVVATVDRLRSGQQ